LQKFSKKRKHCDSDEYKPYKKAILKAVFGSEAQVQVAIENSAVSNMINASFVERHNGTDRNRNARKVRKTYCFSKKVY